MPIWARDAKRLFWAWEDAIWAADVSTHGDIRSGKPRLLFKKPQVDWGSLNRSYDLSLDGRRFLMVKQEKRKPTPVTEMVLVENWFEELKRLAAVKK